ncbi:MAG: hypothetical protein ABS75_30410 [Pelagibacterium sp. SCN 63-23]|nr:MAG: hypothetical protein ABS75_30410 [Pelagibacterium sp. SCN 63-23]
MNKLIVSLLLMLLLTPSVAAETVKRHVLALYNGSDERAIKDTRLHLMLETPFNHLGYILDYREMSAGLPDAEALRQYAGVVSWIEADVVLEEDYFRQANAAMDAGVKWVVFGDIGASSNSRAHPEYDGFLRRLGLFDTGEYTSVTYDSTYDVVNPDYFGFEAQFSDVLPGFPVFVAAENGAEILLSARSPRMAEPAVLASVTGQGGYVASGFSMKFFEDLQRTMWFLDPFRYLEHVMDKGPWPVPDTTTLSGRRVYFSHIDGDGWVNASQAEPGQVSAEVIQHQVIEAYPDLPVSVGLVAGDIVYDELYSALVERTAREIFALPQVEVASHTMTHPFLWTELVNYDRQAELDDIAARALAQSQIARLDTQQQPPLGDPWRFYSATPYDVDEEIAGALAISNGLAPEGKTAQLYLWSGDTSPGPVELAATREAGVLNMNGGDSRLDGEYPSYTYVAPLTRVVGSERQVYAVNSNENTYTNLWRGPYYGQYLLEETWQRTGTPFRLRPMNLYYHMYAGERFGSLQALIHHLDIARSGEVTPVEASAYPRMVAGFFTTRIEQRGPLSWSVSGYGDLGTLRFDGIASTMQPDYAASQGVVGHRYDQGSLYLALDTSESVADIVLAGGPGPILSLRQSRWKVSDAALGECRLDAVLRGFGRPELELWAPDGVYQFTLTPAGGAVIQGTARSENGVLSINTEITSFDPVALTVRCEGTEP